MVFGVRKPRLSHCLECNGATRCDYRGLTDALLELVCARVQEQLGRFIFPGAERDLIRPSAFIAGMMQVRFAFRTTGGSRCVRSSVDSIVATAIPGSLV